MTGIILEPITVGDAGEALVCSLAQFKTRYGFQGEADDEAILQVLRGVSAQIAGACGRVWGGQACLLKAERIHTIQVTLPNDPILYLPAWPVVDVDEVIEALYGAFDAEDELVADEDYALDAEHGTLERIGGGWLFGLRSVAVAGGAVRVTYTAGYTSPSESEGAGYVAAAGEVLLPADLVEAGLQQSGFAWQRRSALGLAGGSAGQGGSASWSAEDDLLAGVKAVCQNYRRITI